MLKFKNFLFFTLFSLALTPVMAQGARNCALNEAANSRQYACLVVDARPGHLSVLDKAKADQPRYPASLTKLMTLYLTFSAIRDHKIRFDNYLTASSHAAAQPSMRIALNPGEKVSVKSLVDSLVVVSANDSAVVLAEKIGGTEKNFARLMTIKARQLGMHNTFFTNASGLYNAKQVTTALDMAKLMIAIKRDFPQYYHILSLTHYTYKGVHYGPHTRLVKNYTWAKAAKTGFISQSGFNLVLNAVKNNKNLVAVIMGGTSAKNRDDFMYTLLNRTFSINPDRPNTRRSHG
jgi:D-alanyl-D-alanine carboxypeptidase